ncbi:MAG: flagellar basal body rod protein FlgC [Proteobacteria bacterium]|nr:flagellar basal body rod protein FlgC [Pseudomonadota bacterium]
MSLGQMMDIAVAGMAAQRARMTVTASNIANANTTRTEEGGPYRRRDPVFRSAPLEDTFGDHLARELRTVRVDRVASDPREFVTRLQPGHPDADENGIVRYPQVNIAEEMGNLMSASRSFEANVLLVNKARAMGRAIYKIGS